MRLVTNVLGVLVVLAATPAHATYSIVATDTASRQVGGAGTSCVGSLSVRVIYGSVPGKGALHAQAQLGGPGKNAAVSQLGMDAEPSAIIASITNTAFDANAQRRQYGIVDLMGRSAGFTGTQTQAFTDDRQAQVGTFTYSVQGNILTSAAVLDQAAASFQSMGCDLADRLMLALEAGAQNGEGDSRCTSGGIPADSAFIQVDREGEPAGTWLQLEVTDTAPQNPLVLLRAQYDTWRATHPCPAPAMPDAGAGGDAGLDPGDMTDGGCCSGTSGGSSWPLVLAVALLGLRRRRRTTRAVLVAALVGSLCGCKDRGTATPVGSSPETGSSKHASASPFDTAPLRPALEAAPAPPSPETETSVEPIGFNWGPPCRVPAVQEVDDDGRRARLAFDVVLESSASGLVAKLENMRAVAIPGAAQVKAALDTALLSLDGAIPPIQVADSGESRGAVDIDRAIDAVVKLLPSNDAKTAAMLEKMFRSPQWRAAFAQKAGETWDAWVGSFTGMDIAPHTVRRDKIDLPTAMGTFKDVAITVTHHGAVRDAQALSLISVEQTIEGPELGAFLVGMVKDFMPASAGAPPTSKHARKTDTITVAIDPVLGRPHRSRHVMAIEVEDRRKRKTRDTAFDWSRATGCATDTPAASDHR